MSTCTRIAIRLAVGCLVLMPGPGRGGDGSMEREFVELIGQDTSSWRVINDGVMGGLSQSSVQRSDSGFLLFRGELSLENNGGFASARSFMETTDLSDFAGIELQVRGDGRDYQLRLRTDRGFDGASYRANFSTVANGWFTVRIPFTEFLPVFRGRVLSDWPALDTSNLQQLGFLLSDKTPGTFRLEIKTIRALTNL